MVLNSIALGRLPMWQMRMRMRMLGDTATSTAAATAIAKMSSYCYCYTVFDGVIDAKVNKMDGARTQPLLGIHKDVLWSRFLRQKGGGEGLP